MARNTELINDDPFAPVRQTRIEHRGRATDKFMIEIQRPDSDEWVELPGVGVVHTADYQLVSNKDVYDMAGEVMEATNLPFKPIPTWGGGHSVPLAWDQKRFSAKWMVEDATFAVPGGSRMMMGVEARNSYDGSCKVGLAFFAMHCVCSNQFYSANMLGKPFVFPHVNRGGTLAEDMGPALEQLKWHAANFLKLKPNFDLMAETQITSMPDFLQIRRHMRDALGVDTRDKALLDELDGHGITAELNIREDGATYDGDLSFWSLGNAFTALTTHRVGGLRGADQSGRVVDFLLEEAARRREGALTPPTA